MATGALLATALAVEGLVKLEDCEGEISYISRGNNIFEGDVLTPSQGGRVELLMADGARLRFSEPRSINFPTQPASNLH